MLENNMDELREKIRTELDEIHKETKKTVNNIEKLLSFESLPFDEPYNEFVTCDELVEYEREKKNKRLAVFNEIKKIEEREKKRKSKIEELEQKGYLDLANDEQKKNITVAIENREDPFLLEEAILLMSSKKNKSKYIKEVHWNLETVQDDEINESLWSMWNNEQWKYLSLFDKTYESEWELEINHVKRYNICEPKKLKKYCEEIEFLKNSNEKIKENFFKLNENKYMPLLEITKIATLISSSLNLVEEWRKKQGGPQAWDDDDYEVSLKDAQALRRCEIFNTISLPFEIGKKINKTRKINKKQAQAFLNTYMKNGFTGLYIAFYNWKYPRKEFIDTYKFLPH